MSTPIEHAALSARRFGGQPEDYLKIHEFMDSTKGAHPDVRHRFVTHNSWFISNCLEAIFGVTITNTDGVEVAVRSIGEWHIREDYKGNVPSLSDFAAEINLQPWMKNGENGEAPPSSRGLPPPDLELLYNPPPPEVKKSFWKWPGGIFSPKQPGGFEISHEAGRCGGEGRID